MALCFLIINDVRKHDSFNNPLDQLFQENVDLPVASVSTKDISLSTLFEMVEANQFLQLPRLSSQDIFDQLCPGLISLSFLFSLPD